MVERHADMRFGPGALVFPGGKLDSQDVDPAWSDYALGWAALDAESRVLRICAIRETFEETGILLAPLGDQHTETVADRAALMRSAVVSGDLSFLEMVTALGLQLDLDALIPFSRWITPTRQPIRFDAAFYIARAPQDQSVLCDGQEIVAADWFSPAAVLSLGDRKKGKLMRPTRANLNLLAAETCVQTALSHARNRPLATTLLQD
jgi:8-oxo-dGTP pyrophosphatase MutT (NUDIX family)